MRSKLVALLAVLLGVSACTSGTPAAAPASASATVAATASADPATAKFQQDWNKLVGDAKAEGEVVITAGPEGGPQDGDWYNAFGTAFGIKVTLVTGSSSEVTSRILAERAQGVYTFDVMQLGGSGTTRLLKAGSVMTPIMPQIIVPDELDRSKGWTGTAFPWFPDDTDHKFVTFLELDAKPVFMDIWYNTKDVSKDDWAKVKSFQDLLDPKWKGKIALGNVAQDEAAGDRTHGWVILGQKYWDTLVRTQNVKVIPYGAARDYADGLARGTYDIGFFAGGADPSLQDAIKQGLPVAVNTNAFAEGAIKTLAGGIGIYDKAKHPNAAKLFVNWALSKDGQAAYNNLTHRLGRGALRTDVAQGKLTNDLWVMLQDQKIGIVDEGTPEYLKASTDSKAFFTKLFTELKLIQ